MASLRVHSSFAAAPARSCGLAQSRYVFKAINSNKSKSKGSTVQTPQHQGKPNASTRCDYFSRWSEVQKATDDAASDLGKAGGLTHGLDTAVVRFVGASALHTLMLNTINSSKAAVTSGAIARQERSVRQAARTAAILLLNRLNGHNMLQGLSFLNVPYSLSTTLISTLLPLGLITPGGQPVLRQQGQQPFRVSADKFRRMEPVFIGRWDDVFGSDDMIGVPDPFPWLNADDFAQLTGLETTLLAHMFSLKQPAVQHLISIVDGLIPSSPTCPLSTTSMMIWATQLVQKYAAVFCNNSKASDIACTKAASCNTWVCKAGQGGGPCVSGDGGSGGRVCLTAVGGDDEGEKVRHVDSCVPVIRAGMREEESSRVSMVGRIKHVARSMGSMVGCFVCRCF